MKATAISLLEAAQPFALALVQDEETRTGSRMLAYERVAADVGASASWLRTLIRREPVALHAHQYLNLALAYRTLCERIEAKAEEQRLRAAQAKERTNAALECARLARARDLEAHSGGEGRAIRLARGVEAPALPAPEQGGA